jgi:hypothetical protein
MHLVSEVIIVWDNINASLYFGHVVTKTNHTVRVNHARKDGLAHAIVTLAERYLREASSNSEEFVNHVKRYTGYGGTRHQPCYNHCPVRVGIIWEIDSLIRKYRHNEKALESNAKRWKHKYQISIKLMTNDQNTKRENMS